MREGEALARARVKWRRLRYVHWPRTWFRWVEERFPVFVSPLVKPIRTSLTSGEGGGIRAPSFKSKSVSDVYPVSIRRGGVWRVRKRGRVFGGSVWAVEVLSVGIL